MEFKNTLQRPIGGLLRPFAWLLGLLGLVWLLFGESTNAEPARERSSGRRTSEQVEVQHRIAEVERKLSAPAEPWEAVRARAVEAARKAVGDREARLTAETAALATAMRAQLERSAPAASERLARIINLDGLAGRIIVAVDERAERGAWLPLGREKAAAFLASVAFHESSWRWRDRNLRGALGERGAFQVAPATARLVGRKPEEIAGNFSACLNAAVDVMHLCVERCGEHPFERAMGCYATAGICGGAPEVVEQRFETARRLLRETPSFEVR